MKRIAGSLLVDEDEVSDEDNNERIEHSGIYIDVENLRSDGHAMVENLIENWPDKAPSPSRLILYVPADQVELWKLWATSRFNRLEVSVHGTQHFSLSPTKNSADIAIAVNAMADMILRRITHAVIFSDDSDFISLYVAMRDEPKIALSGGRVPFLWVVTDREGSLSAQVKRFFPKDLLHVISIGGKKNSTQVPTPKSQRPKGVSRRSNATSGTSAEMARAVVEGTEVGLFKSTDCQKMIKERWRTHPMASAGGAAFGAEFKNSIWPVLEGWGVKISNPGRNPIRYQMTEEAKTNAL